VPLKTLGFPVSLPTDSFPFNLCYLILSSQNCLLLLPSPSLAYVKHCLLLSPSASYWIGVHQAARSSSCCLPQPLWPVMQPEVLLAASLSLSGPSCSQKFFLLPPSASLARHAARNSSCCLPQPLWPVMQPNLLVSFSLSSLRHTATTACCRLLQPPMSYIDQPEVLLAASSSLSDLCHEVKPAGLLQPLLAYITLRSTRRQHSHYFYG